MEQYFRQKPNLSDEAKLDHAVMYLVDDAKLWWKTRMEDNFAGRPVLEINNYYTLPFSLPAPTTRPGTVALYLYLGFAGLETQHLDSFSQEAIAVRNIPLPLLFHLPQLVDL